MVRAYYFDGSSTRICEVTLSVVGADLQVTGAEVNFIVPFSRVQVDERLGRAARKLRFETGSFCEVRDLEALDALLRSIGHRDGWLDRLQRHRLSILISCFACVLLLLLGYKYVLPWAAERGARHVPAAVGRTLSQETLKTLDDGHFLSPSKLPIERQTELANRFRALRLPGGGNPHSALLFRESVPLGANAFTLPDGTIVILDGLVNAIQDDAQIMAVASHELGHAYGRHGLRLLLQGAAVGAFWSFYVGDISQLLAAAPAALIHARYSRDFERQADDYAAAVLRANGLSPGLLADALEKLVAVHSERDANSGHREDPKRTAQETEAGYLASHPPSDERMRHLRELARP